MTTPTIKQSACQTQSPTRAPDIHPDQTRARGKRTSSTTSHHVHQRAVGEILSLLRTALIGSKDVDVLLVSMRFDAGSDSALRPDILVSKSVKARDLPLTIVADIPLIAVEIQSEKSLRDLSLTYHAYHRAGVAEYWIVDTDTRIVERWTPGNTGPEICESILVWDPPGAPRNKIDLRSMFGRILEGRRWAEAGGAGVAGVAAASES